MTSNCVFRETSGDLMLKKWLHRLQSNALNRELALAFCNQTAPNSGYSYGYTGYRVVTEWLQILKLKDKLVVTEWLQILKLFSIYLAIAVTSVTKINIRASQKKYGWRM